MILSMSAKVTDLNALLARAGDATAAPEGECVDGVERGLNVRVGASEVAYEASRRDRHLRSRLIVRAASTASSGYYLIGNAS